jgi:GTPase SAR1 family protein
MLMEQFVERQNAIVEKINGDPKGLERFLRSNPYDNHDSFDLSGLLDESLFFDCLYYESVRSKEYKRLIVNEFVNDYGRNTFFIIGYQGCGKTTLAKSVLNDCFGQNYEPIQSVYIDCAPHARINKIESIQQPIYEGIQRLVVSDASLLQAFESFFVANATELVLFPCSEFLFEVLTYFRKIISDNKSLDVVENLFEFKAFFGTRSLSEMLHLVALLLLSRDYHSGNARTIVPIHIFIDNMDHIDEYEVIDELIGAVTEYENTMKRVFVNLKLSKESTASSGMFFTNKITTFIAMRETTFRMINMDAHNRDRLSFVRPVYDVTEWFEKTEIVEKRLAFLDSSSTLSEEKAKQIKQLSIIIKDYYTNRLIVPLFNNNYRRITGTLAKILSSDQLQIEEYMKLIISNSRHAKYGARATLLKLVLNVFNDDINEYGNYFARIGVVDFSKREPERKVSIARVILAYLSNHTETLNTTTERSVSLGSVVTAMDKVFSRDDVIRSIINMYLLKDSDWSHLISFNEISFPSRELTNMIKNNNFTSIDLEKTMLHYTCAGKVYLETVSSHFEFFSVRLKNGTSHRPLFCSANSEQINSAMKIIRSVLDEVKICSGFLQAHNEQIINSKKFSGLEEYGYSSFISKIKRISYAGGVEVASWQQFHEDRLINSHIDYVDHFRLFFMESNTGLDIETRNKVNKDLCGVLKEYVDLLENGLCNQKTKFDLIPEYRKNLEMIENSGYCDFTSYVNPPQM